MWPQILAAIGQVLLEKGVNKGVGALTGEGKQTQIMNIPTPIPQLDDQPDPFALFQQLMQKKGGMN